MRKIIHRGIQHTLYEFDKNDSNPELHIKGIEKLLGYEYPMVIPTGASIGSNLWEYKLKVVNIETHVDKYNIITQFGIDHMNQIIVEMMTNSIGYIKLNHVRVPIYTMDVPSWITTGNIVYLIPEDISTIKKFTKILYKFLTDITNSVPF